LVFHKNNERKYYTITVHRNNKKHKKVMNNKDT